jgi:thiazole synthase
MKSKDELKIGDKAFASRLFTGTGKFGSLLQMKEALLASGSQLVTVALKRVDVKKKDENILDFLADSQFNILPNTSGVRNANEAIFAANVAREALGTNWLKLEIHPDPRYLMPDPVETLAASIELVKQGFIVLPYIHADPVLCKRLEDAGVAAGMPSHAAQAMEMGADAVLVNTAIATAGNPVMMAQAFREAVDAGRKAFLSGLPQARSHAEASSPLTAFLNA